MSQMYQMSQLSQMSQMSLSLSLSLSGLKRSSLYVKSKSTVTKSSHMSGMSQMSQTCLLITLIKCLKGHKSLGSLGSVVKGLNVSLVLPTYQPTDQPTYLPVYLLRSTPLTKTKTSETSETSVKTILQTCDNWDTNYNSYNWEPEFMTIFVIWQSRVTLDSIRNFCDVFLL